MLNPKHSTVNPKPSTRAVELGECSNSVVLSAHRRGLGEAERHGNGGSRAATRTRGRRSQPAHAQPRRAARPARLRGRSAWIRR